MGFVNYMYPMVINWSNRHRTFKDKFIDAMLSQIQLFYDAAKSNQISRLYLADSGISALKEFLRLAAHHDPKLRLLSGHQHEVAERHLTETGAMLGAWIKKARKGNPR